MSVTVISLPLTPMRDSKLKQAVLETLAYSDIFDYPLTFEEVFRYLTIPATEAQLADCIRAMQHDSMIGSTQPSSLTTYYHLPNRSETVEIRLSRDAASRKAFQRALRYGRILGNLPFVRMAAMTGSLAVLNLSNDADMDYMLITQSGRLWLVRAFAVTFGRLMRLFGDRICVNLLVSENALEWPLHDLYSAREMGQMIPIAGMEMYRRLRAVNPWTDEWLPNANSMPEHAPSKTGKPASLLQRLLEFPLRGRFGVWLEDWVMRFQLRRIDRQYGQGAEANFTADVCKGNFHDHRKWTDEFFQARLVSLGLVSKREGLK